MAFLDGIKQSLKLDEVAGGVASKISSAKEFLHEKQQSVSESGAMRMVKEKVGNLVPPGQLGNVFSASTWSKYFPTGGGKRQSPIDIVTSEARFDETLAEAQFQFDYVRDDCVQLSNSGLSCQVSCRQPAQSTLSASHLPGTYVLNQMHCHWGTEPMNGSEHLVGGVGYAGELHFVHCNAKYQSWEEALKQPDGLAVIGVFLNESHDDNAHLQPLIQLLAKIPYKGDSVSLDQGFDASRLLPDKKEFWTYEGSITTPPLAECVTWTVFRSSIPISSGQLDQLRTLYAVAAEDFERNPQRMAGNVRPPQPLHGRLVRASFRAGGVIDTS